MCTINIQYALKGLRRRAGIFFEGLAGNGYYSVTPKLNLITTVIVVYDADVERRDH
jgi:hypothetical protein